MRKGYFRETCKSQNINPIYLDPLFTLDNFLREFSEIQVFKANKCLFVDTDRRTDAAKTISLILCLGIMITYAGSAYGKTLTKV